VHAWSPPPPSRYARRLPLASALLLTFLALSLALFLFYSSLSLSRIVQRFSSARISRRYEKLYFFCSLAGNTSNGDVSHNRKKQQIQNDSRARRHATSIDIWHLPFEKGNFPKWRWCSVYIVYIFLYVYVHCIFSPKKENIALLSYLTQDCMKSKENNPISRLS